jgi:SAM-dependent methyltransferase
MNPYPLLYRLGITPWEREQPPTPVVELSERYASRGRALDIGCGTGRDAVYLAGRGWSVTGVDSVAQALERARERAARADVEVRWVKGDVTRLQTLGIGDGFQVLIDRGCFHGLGDEERARCVRAVTEVAAPGARLALFAFQPRPRGLGPRGVTADEITRRFGDDWDLASSARDSESRPPRLFGDVKPTWYELQRRP